MDWSFSTSSPLTGAILGLLVLAYCYVSYRVLQSIRHSYAVGWYRGVQNVPLVQLMFWVGASPFLLRDLVFYGLKHNPVRTRALVRAEFIANSKTKKIHKNNGCKYAKILRRDSRVAFSSLESGEKKGYIRCNFCFPIDGISKTL